MICVHAFRILFVYRFFNAFFYILSSNKSVEACFRVCKGPVDKSIAMACTFQEAPLNNECTFDAKEDCESTEYAYYALQM